jgi:hypothetical protein
MAASQGAQSRGGGTNNPQNMIDAIVDNFEYFREYIAEKYPTEESMEAMADYWEDKEDAIADMLFDLENCCEQDFN